ncbi:glycerate kinase [soil metagenome]
MTVARSQIEQIYRAAVAAVDPYESVRAFLKPSEDGQHLVVDDAEIEVGPAGVYVIAIGKAGDSMVRGAVAALGDVIRRGIVVTKSSATDRVDRFEYFLGSHPVPDERSLCAGDAVLTFAGDVPEDALVLCLISGGGSALVESLQPGIDLTDLQETTLNLLRGGAPIQDLNAVRSRLSRIKGGGLLAALNHARVVNLIVSDVLGDDLHAIASGPTVRPDDSISAEDVLARYRVQLILPEAEVAATRSPVATRVVANLAKAMEAAVNESRTLGLRPVFLTDHLTGEAREVAKTIAAILTGSLHTLSPFQSGSCLLAGGETTVTVRGDGDGGRNTELALAAALELRGTTGLTVGFLATDGDDGLTSAAGGIVDGATITSENAGKARRALDANDSAGFLSGIGAVWAPGTTGTNVNDLVIGIVE